MARWQIRREKPGKRILHPLHSIVSTLSSPTLRSFCMMAVCAQCGGSKDLKLCSRCHTTEYCSRECQVQDWKRHKQACGQPEKASPALPSPPAPFTRVAVPPNITSLYMSRIDLTIKEGRHLVYYSDTNGVSELDLSQYIGNNDGKLVWDSSGFHETAVQARLINGHVLAARLLRDDGKPLATSSINLDTRIHCDDEVLVYDAEREKYGELVWPWTRDLEGYNSVFDPDPPRPAPSESETRPCVVG